MEHGSRLDGRYRVLRPLGQGGLASVYLIRDEALGREVALKLLRLGSHEIAARFRHEFALLAASRHPRLPRVFDFGRAGAQYYYTVEAILGAPLDAWASDRPLEALAQPAADLLSALAWLHRLGVVHGDVKPANVLVREGRATLIDFSAARTARAAATGTLDGTLSMMAPEVLRGEAPDARADVFSAGRTLALLLAHASPSPDLERALHAMCAPDPSARPADGAAALELLAEVWPGLSSATQDDREEGETGRLFGRDAELQFIGEAVNALSRGAAGPRVVAVTGPTGVGRSRLLREALWRAQLTDGLRAIEVLPAEPLAIERALARALGDEERGPSSGALLELRERAARAPQPVFVMVDGLERLDPAARAQVTMLLRSAQPSDRLGWLVSASALAWSSTATRVVELRPLDEPSIRAWLEPRITSTPWAEVARITGGLPARVVLLDRALATKRLRESQIATFGEMGDLEQELARELSSLEPAVAVALAELAIAGEVAAGECDARAVEELERRGVARLEGGSWRSSVLEAETLLATLPREATVTAARRVADRSSPAARGERDVARASALSAIATRARARCEPTRAAEELAAAARLFEWAPEAWLRTAELVARTIEEAAVFASAARAALAAGDAPRAIEFVARGLYAAWRGARAERDLAELAVVAASAYESRGAIGKAKREISRARRALSAQPADEPIAREAALIAARVALREGAYREAVAEAERAARSEERSIAALARETAGVALGYLGDTEGAARELDAALELRSDDDPPRARVRAWSYRALAAYRAGDTRGAASAFRAALAHAERAALGDLVANAALNLGTALHQLGDWGGALRSYERGERAADAFGRERTATTLRFDLAKLDSDIGFFERAATRLRDVRARLESTAAPELVAACAGLAAEIACGSNDFDAARKALGEALADSVERGLAREAAECSSAFAEVELARRDLDAARTWLGRAEARLAGLGAVDLELRHACATAELEVARGDTGLALEAIERARARVERVDQAELRARLELVAASAYAARGGTVLAEQHRTAALACLERIAATLPEALASHFWRHPRRATLRAGQSAASAAPASASADGERTARRLAFVMRLLEVNRRLSSTLDTQEILRVAMDAAIELTGAERGFVLLRTDGPRLEVAVARNVDKESVGKSQLKFSHSIAKKVIERGEPTVSVDALSDERFASQASVHALKLRSIACVPIRAHDVVLGALYLDNRFERGRFDAASIDLFSAFADQIALAIHNGRLVRDLAARTRALEAEQQRVAELMRTQADEIDRLHGELDRERERRSVDAPHPTIVGRAPAMRSVLGTIARFAKSDMPLLVRGESGTGKELVARAVHEESTRRAGPFIAVNCAALPEQLLESELFGHVRGAFTGALRDHGGLFVAASGGTLFLDELGETPLSVQAKLLRVLADHEVRPIGAERGVAVDVRVVCATNRDLREEVARGRFREDLFYRVCVLELVLPPLRERIEDVPLLASTILEKLAERAGEPAKQVTAAALRKLVSYAWPGNVRQLENVLARAAVLTQSEAIGPADIELPTMTTTPARRARTRAEHRDVEAERIRDALEQTGWNVCDVSRNLGIPRTTLYRKLARYGLVKG
ncbi:MAG: sigma 54-interacting transcriptional regulator [Polyangiaceae bacterium]